MPAGAVDLRCTSNPDATRTINQPLELNAAPSPKSLKTIQVKVKPNARVSVLEEVRGGPWLAQLKSPPIDGKANQELIALVARHFGCARSAVFIKSGAAGRMKLVRIAVD